MAKTVADVMKMVKENEVKFVDFRFTDTRGKQQHTTVPVSHFDEDKFISGHAFDGSSIAGWKGIEASDMQLIPDPNSANIDPFFEETTLILTCDVIEPSDGKAYDRDPRSIAKRAEAYLKASGLGDTAYFGPEPEFFIFDGVRWSTEPNHTFYEIEEYEAPWNTGSKLEAPAATPAAQAFDIAKFAGIFAAIGLALGALGTALAAVVTGFLSLPAWQMPVVIAGVVLLISGPSMLLAWLKLRNRNLGPLLDANGWAVNTRARINIPFGAALTGLATLPAGARRSLSDPYAEKQTPWGTWMFLLIVVAIAIVLWRQGVYDSFLG